MKLKIIFVGAVCFSLGYMFASMNAEEEQTIFETARNSPTKVATEDFCNRYDPENPPPFDNTIVLLCDPRFNFQSR